MQYNKNALVEAIMNEISANNWELVRKAMYANIKVYIDFPLSYTPKNLSINERYDNADKFNLERKLSNSVSKFFPEYEYYYHISEGMGNVIIGIGVVR